MFLPPPPSPFLLKLPTPSLPSPYAPSSPGFRLLPETYVVLIYAFLNLEDGPDVETAVSLLQSMKVRAAWGCMGLHGDAWRCMGLDCMEVHGLQGIKQVVRGGGGMAWEPRHSGGTGGGWGGGGGQWARKDPWISIEMHECCFALSLTVRRCSISPMLL